MGWGEQVGRGGGTIVCYFSVATGESVQFCTSAWTNFPSCLPRSIARSLRLLAIAIRNGNGKDRGCHDG